MVGFVQSVYPSPLQTIDLLMPKGIFSIMVKVLDPSLETSEFELQLRYHDHFRTNALRIEINPLYRHPPPTSYGLNSTACWLGFGVLQHTTRKNFI